MTQFSLEIQFDSTGLKTLQQAGQKVAIVKETNPTAKPVIWVAFFPETENTVTWNEIYAIYASNQAIQSGATIFTENSLQAVAGSSYPFSGGQFHPGTPGLGPNQYQVKNADPNFQILTAGLAQAAGGSGGNGSLTPLNATVVPFNETGTYSPIEKVSVFAEAQASNGLVISEVSTEALLVDLTTTPSQTIHYDSSQNVFAIGPLS